MARDAMWDDLLTVWRVLTDSDRTVEETHAEVLRRLPRLLVRAAAAEGRLPEALDVLRPRTLIIRWGDQDIEVPWCAPDDR